MRKILICFCNDTAATEIYPLSLPSALQISPARQRRRSVKFRGISVPSVAGQRCGTAGIMSQRPIFTPTLRIPFTLTRCFFRTTCASRLPCEKTSNLGSKKFSPCGNTSNRPRRGVPPLFWGYPLHFPTSDHAIRPSAPPAPIGKCHPRSTFSIYWPALRSPWNQVPAPDIPRAVNFSTPLTPI